MLYFDNNATTRPDPAVVRLMLQFLETSWANPSSLHRFAEASREALEQSRVSLGRLLGARGAEIVWTSGATEACNLAIFGAAEAFPARRHILVSAVEHRAVLAPLERLATRGWEVEVVGVGEDGRVSSDEMTSRLREDTLLVALQYANNETGVIMPVEEVAHAAQRVGALTLCDASQAVGRMDLSLRALGVDLLALSAHKFHGPKGVGALVVRRGVPLVAQRLGGGQEYDIRSGTENVPGIVGAGMAAWLARERMGEGSRVAALRDALQAELLHAFPDARVNGEGAPRLPNTLNLSFLDVSGEALLQELDVAGVAASSSSACQSNEPEPSHVLTAMGVDARWLRGSLRLGLSRETTADEVERLVEVLRRVVPRARAAAGAVASPPGDFAAWMSREPHAMSPAHPAGSPS